MTRRQLESALLASALIENGLSTVFRFTRIRFQQTFHRTEYQTPVERDIVKVPEKSECCHCTSTCEPPLQSKSSCPDGDVSHRVDFGIHTLKLSADAKLVVVGDASSSVRVIDVPDGRQQRVLRPSKWKLGMPVTCLCYVPNNLNRLLGCTPHGEIFSLDLGQEGFETLIKEENQQTYCLDISPDGTEVATAGNDASIRIYSICSGQLSGVEKSGGEIYSNKSRLDKARRFETKPRLGEGRQAELMMHQSTRACRLQDPLLNRADGSELPEILGYRPAGPADNYTKGHSMRITALKYHSSQPKLLASASWDHHVKIWDTRTRKEPVYEIYGPLICSPEGLDIDDNYVLTASWRKCQALEIWDLRNLYKTKNGSETVYSGDILNTLNKQAYMSPAETIPVVNPSEKHCTEYLYSARIVPSRAVVCGGSGFREVRVVSRDTKLTIVRIPVESAVQTLDTVLEGRFIAAGCANGSITIAGLA